MVVVEDLSGEGVRPVGEDDVVLGEAFFGGGGGGDQEELARAAAEEEDLAVLGGEGLKGPVDRFFEKMEVADDGERRWAWWQFVV